MKKNFHSKFFVLAILLIIIISGLYFSLRNATADSVMVEYGEDDVMENTTVSIATRDETSSPWRKSPITYNRTLNGSINDSLQIDQQPMRYKTTDEGIYKPAKASFTIPTAYSTKSFSLKKCFTPTTGITRPLFWSLNVYGTTLNYSANQNIYLDTFSVSGSSPASSAVVDSTTYGCPDPIKSKPPMPYTYGSTWYGSPWYSSTGLSSITANFCSDGTLNIQTYLNGVPYTATWSLPSSLTISGPDLTKNNWIINGSLVPTDLAPSSLINATKTISSGTSFTSGVYSINTARKGGAYTASYSGAGPNNSTLGSITYSSGGSSVSFTCSANQNKYITLNFWSNVDLTGDPDSSIQLLDPSTNNPLTNITTTTSNIKLSGKVKNIGTVSTGTGESSYFQNFFEIDYQKDPPVLGIEAVASNVNTPLAANATATTTVTSSGTIYFPYAGTSRVRVCADKTSISSGGRISESNNITPPNPPGGPVPPGTGEQNNCGPWTTVNVTSGASAISVDLTASPISMTLPTNSTTLAWTTTGTPDSCTASGSWSGAKTVSGGTENKTGLVAGTYTYTITCSKTGVTDATDSVSVVVSAGAVPIVTISANPTSGTVGSVSPTITYSATNNPTSCTATGDWVNLSPPTATGTSQTQAQGVLSTIKTYTYTLTCTNSYGTGSPASATVNVTAESSVPILTDTSITNITSANATLGGTVFSWGTPAQGKRGTCWSASDIPTPLTFTTMPAGCALKDTVNTGSTGNFSHVRTISPTRPLYVRAFAGNDSGIGWGPQKAIAADLTAGAVDVSGEIVSGVDRTYTATISNIGNFTTGSSFHNFFQKATVSAAVAPTLPQGDSRITDLPYTSTSPEPLSALNSGGTATVTSPSVAFSSSGSIRVCADKTTSSGGSSINEANDSGTGEDNNCGPWTDVEVDTTGALSASSPCEINVNNECTTTLTWNIPNPLPDVETAVTTPDHVTVPGTSAVSGMTTYTFIVDGPSGNPNSRMFYLYHDELELANAQVRPQCPAGEYWNGSTCALAVADYWTYDDVTCGSDCKKIAECRDGTDEGEDENCIPCSPEQAGVCEGGIPVQSCAPGEGACPLNGPLCSSPPNHLSPCIPGSTSSAISSSTSKWTWTCTPAVGDVSSCTEWKKQPIIIED